MLAEGQQPVDVARVLNINRRTVERWLDKPEFRVMLEDAKAKAIAAIGEEVFTKCKEALVKGLPKAVRRILEGLDDSDARIRIRSSEAIARWTGFYQPNKPTLEQQGNAELNLKGYLAYLETTNGNGNQHKSVQR